MLINKMERETIKTRKFFQGNEMRTFFRDTGYSLDDVSGKICSGNDHPVALFYKSSYPQVIIKIPEQGPKSMRLEEFEKALILKILLDRRKISCEFSNSKGLEKVIEDLKSLISLWGSPDYS
jgi:hypothetical protein